MKAVTPKTIKIELRGLKGSTSNNRNTWTVQPVCIKVVLNFKLHQFGFNPVLTLPEQKFGVWRLVAEDEKLYQLSKNIFGLQGVMSVELGQNVAYILAKARSDEQLIASGIAESFKTHFRASCEDEAA